MMRIQTHGFPPLRARHPMARPVTATPPAIALHQDAWPDFWADAVRALRALGYRTSTLLFYRQVLRAFARFVDKPPRSVLSADLLRFACIPATATPLDHAAPSSRASSQACARDGEEPAPTPDTPVVLAPDPAWESLVSTPFPLRSSGEGFLHQCRVKLRTRFLAVRGFFSSG